MLVDSPAAPSGEQPLAPGVPDAPPPDAPPAAPQRVCANCGASMDASQEWCLQCGTGAPDSLASQTPGWRSTATFLGITVLLFKEFADHNLYRFTWLWFGAFQGAAVATMRKKASGRVADS